MITEHEPTNTIEEEMWEDVHYGVMNEDTSRLRLRLLTEKLSEWYPEEYKDKFQRDVAQILNIIKKWD